MTPDIWLWVALGALVGFLAGVTLRDAIDLIPPTRRSAMPTTTHKPRARAVLVVILTAGIAINAVLGGLLIVQRAQTNDVADCNAAYNEQFSRAYQARLDAGAPASAALEDTLEAIAKQDEHGVWDASQRYLKARDELRASQAANPYPPLPDDFCARDAR